LEGYVKGAGWALTEKRTYENQEHQDQLDAATIYGLLENEIVPLYYAKNAKGFSPEWIQTIKNSLAQITPRFTTKRMIDDYIERFYNKLATRSSLLNANDYAKAKEIASWKEKMALGWDKIEVVSIDVPEKMIHNPEVGEVNNISIVIDVKDPSEKGIGIELVTTKSGKNNVDVLYNVEELKLVKTDGTMLYFNIEKQLNMAGTFKYGFRMFPKNEDLPHRQDFCYVRWI